MTINVDNARAYIDGYVAVAPVGSTLPTTATSVLDAAFEDLGVLNEDGVTESWDQTVTDVFGWQNGVLVKKIFGQTSVTFQFAAMETNVTTLGLYYAGSAITQNATGAHIAVVPPKSNKQAFVLHGIEGTRLQRKVVPNGEVTERGDLVWVNSSVSVYEYTLTAYPDEDGVLFDIYLEDPALASP